MNRLAQLKRRYNLPMLTGGLSSNSKALNPNAISSGGPATPASDRVTRYAARSMKKGTARVVKKPKGGSAKKEKVKDKETISYKDVKEETEDLGSTTDEDEPIPTDENGKIFPNLGAGGQVTRASSRSSTKLEVDDSTKDDFDSVDDETATLAAAEFLLNAAATDTE